MMVMLTIEAAVTIKAITKADAAQCLHITPPSWCRHQWCPQSFAAAGYDDVPIA
jgi:hypothetical protein